MWRMQNAVPAGIDVLFSGTAHMVFQSARRIVSGKAVTLSMRRFTACLFLVPTGGDGYLSGYGSVVYPACESSAPAPTANTGT